MTDAPFHEDWVECNEVQYMTLAKNGDVKNLASFKKNMLKSGWSEAQLEALYIRATLIEGDVIGHLHPGI